MACCPRMRPSRITTIRSQIAKTSASRCETKMIATPRAFSARMRSKRRADSFSVSAAVGSSRISSRARLASARAITTSCCVARSSEPIGAAGSRSRPKASSASRARRSRPGTSIMPQRVGSSFSIRFSATLRSGTTLTSCGTSATPAASAAATPDGANGSAGEAHAAVVAAGRDDAGEDPDQRRLAGAVLAEQRHDLAGGDREARLVERAHAGEGLGQASATSTAIRGAARLPVRPRRAAVRHAEL